jgi:hypothetical protein
MLRSLPDDVCAQSKLETDLYMFYGMAVRCSYRSRLIVTSVLLACVIFSVWPTHSPAKEEDDIILSEIGGRVVNSQHTPVQDVQVKLLNEKHEVMAQTQVGNDGSFSMKHRPCVVCVLQVIPDDKSNLASALIEKIPGDANRKFLVTLQNGFRVKGRITGAGKGLKGLLVTVVATGDEQAHVHTGGEAKTARDGSFVMNLTPGPKLLTVQNDKYSNFVAAYEHKLNVTADQEMTDIQLPSTER